MDDSQNLRQPCRQPQYQSQAFRGWRRQVWLPLLLSLASSAAALTAPLAPGPVPTHVVAAEANEMQPEQALVETAEPRAILAQAPRWRLRGDSFPDALLRKA